VLVAQEGRERRNALGNGSARTFRAAHGTFHHGLGKKPALSPSHQKQAKQSKGRAGQDRPISRDCRIVDCEDRPTWLRNWLCEGLPFHDPDPTCSPTPVRSRRVLGPWARTLSQQLLVLPYWVRCARGGGADVGRLRLLRRCSTTSCWAVAQRRPTDGCFCNAPENIAGTCLARLSGTIQLSRPARRGGANLVIVSTSTEQGATAMEPRVNKRRPACTCTGARSWASVWVPGRDPENMPHRLVGGMRRASHRPSTVTFPRPLRRCPPARRATSWWLAMILLGAEVCHVSRRWRQRPRERSKKNFERVEPVRAAVQGPKARR
jgi:hypothetical protein